MKRFMMVGLFVVMLAMLVGCDGTSQERLEAQRNLIASYEAQSGKIDGEIGVLTTTLASMRETLESPDISPEQSETLGGLIAKGESAMDVLVDQKAAIDRATAAYKIELERLLTEGNLNIGHELQAIGAGAVIAAPATPPPVSGYLALGGTLIAAIGTIMAARYKAQANANEELADEKQDVVSDLVTSFKLVLDAMPATKEGPPLTKDQATDLLKQKQDKATRIAVEEVKLGLT